MALHWLLFRANVSTVAGRPSSSRAAGPARPGLCRRPAQPGVGRRPVRPRGESGLCRPNSESCCLAGSARRPGQVAQSGTRCDSIRAPDRGGRRGRKGSRRGRGRGGEGRGGELGKRHGGTCCRGPFTTCIGHRDQVPARAQSYARTRAEPPSRQHARAKTCSCTSNRAVHQHTIIHQQIEEISELAEG
jgi:hypothetical protein